MKKITIVGGGNIGTQFTVHFSELGYSVYLYTSHPNDFRNTMVIVNEKDEIIHTSKEFIATNDKYLAFTNSDLIIVTLPAFELEKFAKDYESFAYKGGKILVIPGTGGAEWAFSNCIKKGVELYGLQRVPSVARIVELGTSVRATGYRKTIFLGSVNAKNENLRYLCEVLSKCFKIECISLQNYLSVTLTPSNPILHTSRLYSIFNDYDCTTPYKTIPLFYEDWTDTSSKVLLRMDDELQNICTNLKEFDLSNVLSLKKHYESENFEQLTKKIKSITGFKGLKTPSIRINDGYVPDFTSRYFKADFPYGLAILIQIAHLMKIETPEMDKVYSWYKKIQPDVEEFSLAKYGITNRNQFIDFYK